MKRVNLTKYGFVRWPENDFSDDGSRFQGYKAGKAVRVSKLVEDGLVYLSISADCGKGTLPFDIYSKLPYYNEASWKYNGTSLETLTEGDIQAFYEACLGYEAAYEVAEANLVYPTIEELTEQCNKVVAKHSADLAEIENTLQKDKLTKAATKLTKYEWQQLQESIIELVNTIARYNPEKYPASIYKTAYSFNFMDSTNLTTSTYWYKCIMDILRRHDII